MPVAVGVRATPRFVAYHSASAFGSFALKKKPPMPVTLSFGGFWVPVGWEDVGSAVCTLATLVPRQHNAAEYRRRQWFRMGRALRVRDARTARSGREQPRPSRQIRFVA